MPGAKVITKQKKPFKDSQTRRNMKNAKPRPQQKQKPKKKSMIGKIKDFFDADKTKPGFQFTKPKTAKAATPKIKKKPLSPAQKKKSTAVQKAEDARRKRQKDNMKKKAYKDYYSSVPGYKGKAGEQNSKSKSYRERLADQKKKDAKKASDAKAADTRDAKRGGFITAKAAKTAGEKANAKMAANKKRKSDELVSRGRK